MAETMGTLHIGQSEQLRNGIWSTVNSENMRENHFAIGRNQQRWHHGKWMIETKTQSLAG